MIAVDLTGKYHFHVNQSTGYIITEHVIHTWAILWQRGGRAVIQNTKCVIYILQTKTFLARNFVCQCPQVNKLRQLYVLPDALDLITQ